MTFTITVRPSGRSFTTEPEESILTAGIRSGIGLPYGCKDGACGSCKCKKIEGTVVHGPHQAKALSADEEAAGYVLTCCGVPHSDVVLESRQVTDAGAFPIRKMPVRVARLERLSHDVMGITLQLPANDVIQFHAGQYVEFILRDGARRSYSMANAPHTLMRTVPGGTTSAPMMELHIRHMPGGLFTDQVFSTMKERDILRIEVIEHMQFMGITRPATLYWGGRRPEDLYLDAWVKAQVTAMPNLRYVPVVSDALPEDAWSGRTGFVHRAVLQDFPDLSGHQVYACGAPIVVDSARKDYTSLGGLPEDDFFADSFTSEADKHP